MEYFRFALPQFQTSPLFRALVSLFLDVGLELPEGKFDALHPLMPLLYLPHRPESSSFCSVNLHPELIPHPFLHFYRSPSLRLDIS